MSDITNGQVSPRTNTFLNRPQFSPLGPRTRTISRATTVLVDAPPSATLLVPQDTFGPMSPNMNVKPLPTPPIPLPPIPLLSAASTSSFPDSPPDPDDSSSNQLMSPGALAPRPTSIPSSLTPSELSTQGKYTSSVNIEDSAPMSPPVYHYNHSDVETTARPPALVSSSRVPQAPPKLIPPQPISFESVAVPWKGMPLEPALCKTYLSQVHFFFFYTVEIFRDFQFHGTTRHCLSRHSDVCKGIISPFVDNRKPR